MDDLDRLSLPELHAEVRRRIDTDQPGYAQLRDEPVSTVSLVKDGRRTKLYGLLPTIGRDELRTVAVVRNAVMEALADGDPDAAASRGSGSV